MPLATYQHCIICYKQQKPPIPPPGSRPISKNSEVCRRFCTLASRHLDLDPYFFRWERTLNTKSIINIETVCDECLEPTTSFCDIYGQLEYLQMQLSWRLVEVCRLMTNADKEDSPHQEYRQTLKNKVESFEGTMKDIEEFRAEFLAAVEHKRKRYNPTVEVISKKVNGTAAVQRSDDEDSLFEECTPVKKKKKEEVKKEVKEEVKRRGRPKKIVPGSASPPVALAPTPSPSPPPSPILRATASKKRPLSPPLIPEAAVKKRTTITLVEVNEVPNCQPIKKPCPKSKKKTNPAPKEEKIKPTPKVEKMKPTPKEEKMKPIPKVEKMKPIPKEEKIKPSPKEEKTYFEIDSDSGSDDLFELVKTEKKKPPVSKKPVINLLKKPPINPPAEEDDDEDDDEEEKVTVFSKPGHKISEKDRVPRDLTSFVIGWLNNGK